MLCVDTASWLQDSSLDRARTYTLLQLGAGVASHRRSLKHEMGNKSVFVVVLSAAMFGGAVLPAPMT